MHSIFHRIQNRLNSMSGGVKKHCGQRRVALPVESLESRLLLSVSASAQLTLTATTGSGPSAVYHYDISVTNTGTTNVGTFWFAWVPGEDFLPSAPLSEASPAGWGSALTGGGLYDGSAIQWVASSNAIKPGGTLDGFAFTSPDNPAALAGESPFFPTTDVLTSFVYIGAPEADPGFQFNVSPVATTTPTTTSLAASQSVINQGAAVTLTATVAPTASNATAPTGTVSFSQNGTPLGTAPVQPDGTAQFTISTLSAGSDPIVATYSGDANFANSGSAAVTETVNPGSAATTTALTTAAAMIQSGASVTFTATVAPVAPGGAMPTGAVSFSEDGSLLGSAPLQSDGTAVLSTSALTLGPGTVTATYGGDAIYAGSASAPVSVSVTAPATLVPAIAKSTLPPALVAGAAAHGSATLDISNSTAAAIKGKLTVEIFATTDGAIDGSSIQLSQVVKSLNVKTSKPTAISLPVKIGAALLPAGSYMLVARVVDPSGNANDSAAGPAITVAAPFVALSETFTKMTIPASAVAGAKAHAAAVLRITNNGNTATSGITTVELFATLSGVVDGAATRINDVSKPLKIRPGKSASVSIPVKLIPGVAAGGYTIVAQITDGDGNVTTAVSAVVNITAS